MPYKMIIFQSYYSDNWIRDTTKTVQQGFRCVWVPWYIENTRRYAINAKYRSNKNYIEDYSTASFLITIVFSGEGILHFLVLITGCNSVGKLGTNEIYRVTNVQMISMRGFQPDEQKVEEIKKLLCCGTFYYSWNMQQMSGTSSANILPFHKGGHIDLTLAAQKAGGIYTKTDNRFFW